MTFSQSHLIEVISLCEQSLFLERAQKEKIKNNIQNLSEYGLKSILVLLKKQQKIEQEAIKQKLKAEPNWIHKITSLKNTTQHQFLAEQEQASENSDINLVVELEAELAKI